MHNNSLKNIPNAERKAYVFRITLNNASPKIWRKIVVPSDYTFYALHCAIQDAMWWCDGHLHSFTIDMREKKITKQVMGYNKLIYLSLPSAEDDFCDDSRPKDLDEREELISNWFGVITKQCIYTYDFGDNWDHTILLEKIIPMDQKEHYPKCLGGKNACPPEDCGGTGGYERLQEILADPTHEEHSHILDWLNLETG